MSTASVLPFRRRAVKRLEALWHQAKLVRARQRFAAIFGGFGCGKTHALVLVMINLTARFPGVRFGFASPSFPSMRGDVLPLVRELFRDVDPRAREHQTHHLFWPSWCTTEGGVEFVSCEDPERIKGRNWGGFLLNEPGLVDVKAWRVLMSRARVPLLSCAKCGAWRGRNVRKLTGHRETPHARTVMQALDPCRCGSALVYIEPNYVRLAGTPEGYNWLWDEWMDEAKHPRRDWSDWLRMRVDTRANTYQPPSYREGMEDQLDSQQARQYLEGRFENMLAGDAIYYNFAPERHVDGSVAYDPRRELLFLWDFNIHPLCTVLAQPMPGGELHVVDEIVLEPGRTPEVMIEFFQRYGQHRGEITIIGDWSGNDGDTRGNVSDYQLMAQACRREGREVNFELCPNPGRMSRYANVNRMLLSATGRTRLKIHPRCRRVIRDLEGLGFKPDTTIPDTKGNKLGHAMDALGYGIMMRFPTSGGASATRIPYGG